MMLKGHQINIGKMVLILFTFDVHVNDAHSANALKTLFPSSKY